MRASIGALSLIALVAASVFACSSEESDPEVYPPASPLGSGQRVHEITDPASSKPGENVTISGAVVIASDDFDETRNGKSRGTLYVQDLGSQAPYSGIQSYSASFVPANLRPAPGDVLDLRGKYVELQNIGTAVFDPGEVIPQLERPTATFRFDDKPPEPVDIDIADLAKYDTGRKWLGMLVRVKGITSYEFVTERNRQTDVATGRTWLRVDEDPDNRDAPTVTNELYDMKEADAPTGPITSITGVVTYFFKFHIAPRSAADIEK